MTDQAQPVNPLVGGVSEPQPMGEVAQAQEDMTLPEPKQYDYSVTYKAGEEVNTVSGHVLAVDDDDAKKQVESKYANATYEHTVTEKVVVDTISVKVSGESPLEGDTSVTDKPKS